jgi:cell wall-associated NlpC family hydrolase
VTFRYENPVCTLKHGLLLGTLLWAACAPAQATPAAAGPTAPSAPTAASVAATAQPATLPAAPAGAVVADSPPSDPLLQMLMERGVVQKGIATLQPAVALAQQARDRAAEAVIAAMAYLDLPYVRGGNSAESGFDCSGFTRYIFKNTLGLLLPRSAAQQAQAEGLQPVPGSELKPGDLVFFNTLRKAFSHVGIYIGDGRFVHSPRQGGAVRVENMHQAYWAQRFDGARRPALVASNAALLNSDPRR